MSIKDIKSVDKLQNMLKTAIDENKYLKKCCEKVGNELAKNSFEYDGKEKNLIVQAMVLNEAIETRERALKDIKEIAKILGKRIPFFETEQIARDLQAILTVINEVLSE